MVLRGCCLSMQLDRDRERPGGASLSYQLDSEYMPTVFSRSRWPSIGQILVMNDCDLSRFHGRTVEVMAIAQQIRKERLNAMLHYIAFVRVNDLPETYERIALVYSFRMDGIEHGLKELFAREGQEKTLTII